MNPKKMTYKTIFVVGIMLVIAAIHAFRVGTYLSGEWYILYYSFSSDILIPFGFYFLLSLNDTSMPFLRKWYVKAGIVFGACTISEILQAFGIYALGVTFDPLDILMYAIGTALAVLIEKQLFERFLPFWVLTEER